MRITSIVAAAIAVIAVSLSSPVSAQVGTTGQNDVWTLPPSEISDSAVKAIRLNAENYIAARDLRTASAHTPNCNIASVRSIYPNNEQKVYDIVYGDVTINQTVKQMTLDDLAAKAQKSAEQAKVPADMANVE
jgi:hypothetical protein